MRRKPTPSIESDLARSADDVVAERASAEHARTELAKAQLRLEALPRIEADADRLRAELAAESKARVAAEQQAAVLAAKLEATTDRTTKAEARVEYGCGQGVAALTHDQRVRRC